MEQTKPHREDEEYIKAEGLDRLIDFQENVGYQERVFDCVRGGLKIPFPPEPADLVRLHKIVRQRKCFTVLEFGVGYSTLVIADALKRNQEDWDRLIKKPDIRNRFLFQLFSVDASRHWIEWIKGRIPRHLANRIHIHYSEVAVGTFNGQLCHYFKDLPDVVPDLIYLDGPSSKDVQGKVHGLSFRCDERTVMSGDLLLMESTFLPGTFILVDGRTNNARFLERNFTRDYKITWDREADVTTLELAEERLGKYNLLGLDFFS